MVGMLRQAKKAGCENSINKDNVFGYPSVGCLENTMCGNDLCAMVDCNLNPLKVLELDLGNGRELQDEIIDRGSHKCY